MCMKSAYVVYASMNRVFVVFFHSLFLSHSLTCSGSSRLACCDTCLSIRILLFAVSVVLPSLSCCVSKSLSCSWILAVPSRRAFVSNMAGLLS